MAETSLPKKADPDSKVALTRANSICCNMLQPTFPAGFIAPCLPTKTDKLPSGSQWLHGPLLLPTATVEQTGRIGRYTVVTIEQVVDPHLHHLNVAVALGESVAGKERGPGRNGKCPIVEPKIIILDLRRPIGQEGPLDARAHQASRCWCCC